MDSAEEDLEYFKTKIATALGINRGRLNASAEITARDFEHVQSRFEARVRELCSERGIAFERVVKAVRIVDMLHEVVPK